MKSTLISLFVALLLSSCAFYSGTTSSNVSYNGNNAEIIDMVSAKNTVTRVFGLGGLDKEALILETKRKMYSQNPLKKGQVYANIGVDVKRALYIFVDETTVTVSADVLQFYEDSIKHRVFSKLITQSSSHDKNKIANSYPIFIENQAIYFLDKNKVLSGKIQSTQDLLIKVSTDKNESFYINSSDAFHQIKYDNVSSLEKVHFKNEEQTQKGYIVGFNQKSYVILCKERLLVFKKQLVTHL